MRDGLDYKKTSIELNTIVLINLITLKKTTMQVRGNFYLNLILRLIH